MTRPILPRVNFYDGQEVVEEDLDTEQSAWHGSLANNTDFGSGSGIEQEFATQRVLFDTNTAPASVQTLITNQTLDGTPLYETDSFSATVFTQPSDSSDGVQLEVNLSGASVGRTTTTRVHIYGRDLNDNFIEETLTFKTNESQLTRKFFTEIVSIMTQDFRGNSNTTIDGTASANRGGRLKILEALSMTLARDTVMAEQSIEPYMEYVNFKPASLTKSLNTLLDEIATQAGSGAKASDLNINTTATTTRELPPNVSGIIIGEKFKATTNNIQKVSILLSIKENTLVVSGQEYDWSGDLIVGIRALQTSLKCAVDTVPGSAIEYDPEPSALAEVSLNQSEMLDLGISLDGNPQIVDFIFTQSLLANPNLTPTPTVNAYYMVTVRRSGDISKGTVVIQEAANTDAAPTDTDEMRMSVFSSNDWTDIPESDMWFKVYTDAVRVTDGTAFDEGVQITIPKKQTNTTTGLDESYIEGDYSLLDTSLSAENYAIVQKSTDFTTPETHPTTGNQVNSRIKDVPDISIVSESTLTTLISAGNDTIVLGMASDTNPVNNPTISGVTKFAGLAGTTTFTIINPSSDVWVYNLVGSTLVPNINRATYQYRITSVNVYDDAYGDVNNDGTIDLSDVSRAQALDGYSKDLQSGTLTSAVQQDAIVNGYVTMPEIIRADVNDDGVIDIEDPQLIQQNIVLGTAFIAGSTFKRAVITVENILNPTTTTTDIIGNDSSFNNVPFTNINYRIDYIPTWEDYNVQLTNLRRFVPKTFTEITATDITGSPRNGGENIFFIPDDVLIGGDILNHNKTPYSVDLEVTPIVIDLPEGDTNGEIDIFTNFVKGIMYFSDGTLVTSSALTNNQVRVSTAIKSYVKDLDGYDYQSIDNYDPIDEVVSALYMQLSGVLRIRASNIRYIPTRTEFRTKIILTVYLKKAGFANSEQQVSSSRLNELLTAI
jgi:hypothetical protein